MADPSDTLRALREALRFSPENIPLRQHLADTLLSQGQPEAAEQEYCQALALAPEDSTLKLGLARAFYQQGKDSQALVIVENLVQQSDSPAQAYLLHARLLLRAEDTEAAVHQFRQALEQDPSLQDADLADRLGVRTDNLSEELSDVFAQAQSEVTTADPTLERPTISFQEVGGMESVKEEIRLKIIHPLNYPQLYQAYGKTIGGGILMYGPPGCGKTHLARATAGEIRAKFIAVGINDILDMWLGNSEKNLHERFDQARRNRPCVLFFDEVDALAANRSDLRYSASRQIINQFLAELDGVQSSNEGVLILAATNAPWHLDAAFRRPGRFDRILFVPPPDAQARASILRLLCRGKPVEEIDYAYLSKKTEHFSGADLKAVLDLAVEKKLQEAMKAGVPKPLTTRDLVTAASTLKPSTREWFATARNYALHANQGGIYDDILKYLKL